MQKTVPHFHASRKACMKMGSSQPLLVAVDRDDQELGVLEKMEAHTSGTLHRAFSVFLFDESNRLLLQQRAAVKYHSPGLWSNTCCGHPGPGEVVTESARRRLQEEMGIDCPLESAFGFIYRADLEGGLTEYEYDHVVMGRFDGSPLPNPDEVSDWKWISIPDLQALLERSPETFSRWLPIALEGLLSRSLL